jgi:hypothetical protein
MAAVRGLIEKDGLRNPASARNHGVAFRIPSVFGNTDGRHDERPFANERSPPRSGLRCINSPGSDRRLPPIPASDLVDWFMPFAHPAGSPSMSQLASPFHFL